LAYCSAGSAVLFLASAYPAAEEKTGVLLTANLATHPLVYFGWPWLGSFLSWHYAALLVISEIFAPAVETVVLSKIWATPVRQTAIWVVLANLFSWWVGLLLLYGQAQDSFSPVVVTPAQAGVRFCERSASKKVMLALRASRWIPAFAGMTLKRVTI